jgi:tetratricopeptide (TPR) repeat protein
MATRLRDVDAADRAQLLRVVVFFGPACFVILSMLWYFCREKGWIPGWLFVLLLLLNIPITIAGIFAIHRAVGAASTGLVKTIFAAGDIPPPPSYSLQESMIIRGRYEDAAESFRNHIAEHPEDLDARLALARLLEEHLRDYGAAERLYLEVRRSRPNRNQEMAAANGLIDLCRKAGRGDRLRVELGRFADRYRGSPAAEAAARELRELDAAPTSESPHSPT